MKKSLLRLIPMITVVAILVSVTSCGQRYSSNRYKKNGYSSKHKNYHKSRSYKPSSSRPTTSYKSSGST